MDLLTIQNLCRLIRYNILTSTTQAGSGHPSSCLSAVELMTTLFFGGPVRHSLGEGGFLTQDIDDFNNPCNDRVIFSKGHAAPLLYSLYAAAGVITNEELMNLRKFDSVLEGHPTFRFPYVDVATGSLGQGLSIGLGTAMAIKLKMKNEKLKIEREPKVFVLLGDSEIAEGQIWEAMQIAAYYKLNNLVAILDCNRLGMQTPTMLGWDIETYKKRAESFGWNTIVIEDGHDLQQVYNAFSKAVVNQSRRLGGSVKSVIDSTVSKPTIIIAKTIKGKGVSFLENKEGWHGKTLNKEQLEEALKELGEIDFKVRGEIRQPNIQFPISNIQSNSNIQLPNSQKPLHVSRYTLHELVSTREAYGDALVASGEQDEQIVVLDAEVSTSTKTDKFKKTFPDRFFEMFIAEQNMISTALGFSKQGFIPFVSSFAAFLSRAFDQIRMAQYSDCNLNIVGSHCGVSIGQDGPSQMGLEDIAMMRSILKSIVFYPCDAVSTFKLTEIMAQKIGLFYLRTTREKTPVIYEDNEKFTIGGSKVHKLRVTSYKLRALIIAAGITLHEALKAQTKLANENIETVVLDCYSVKPIDEKTIYQLAAQTENIIVVEDHYPSGGLGEAVTQALLANFKFSHLCVRKLPRSGTPEELMRYEEIDSDAIIKAVKKLLQPIHSSNYLYPNQNQT